MAGSGQAGVDGQPGALAQRRVKQGRTPPGLGEQPEALQCADGLADGGSGGWAAGARARERNIVYFYIDCTARASGG